MSREGGEALARELGASGAFQSCDVRDRGQVEALLASAVERFGRLDVLVNNAGGALPGRAPEGDPQAWLDLFALNVHSIFYACRAAIPVLRRGGGGASVETASVSGLLADYGLGPSTPPRAPWCTTPARWRSTAAATGSA